MKSSFPGTALLLIDVINDMDFPGSEALLINALPAARNIAILQNRLRRAGVPIIYVNDNFGHWQSDFNEQIERCIAAGFVLKPKHSGFYSTSLQVLLQFLKIRTLILTGFAADICVLYTANDAYMRDFDLIVPSDCVASESKSGTRDALQHIQNRLKARVCLSRSLRSVP